MKKKGTEQGHIKKRSQFQETWKRLSKNRLAMVGLAILAILVITAIFADLIAPYPYDEQDYMATLQSPSWEHLMGTDEYGRDIFSRVVYGSRTSLYVGFISLMGVALM